MDALFFLRHSKSRDDTQHIDKNNVCQAEHDRNYQTAQRRLARFGSRCQIHRHVSAEAAQTFDRASLDFVYLDARHYRQALLEDLEAWAPKVRSGGILAGHDYLDGPF